MTTPVSADRDVDVDDPADPVEPSASEAERVDAHRRRAVWVLAVLAAFPAVVAGVVSIGVDWTPASDYAPIEVRARDVLSTHPPVVGAYSRLGGNHPGPAVFQVLAVPYRVLGSEPWALFVTAAFLNAVWMGLAVRIAGRKGQVGLAALVAGLSVACAWGLGVDHLRDVWNPRFPVMAFLVAAIATWAVVVGSRRSLPVAVLAASFCLQAHVGYLGLSAVLMAWCGFGVWRNRSHWRTWRAPIVVAVVIAGLMWAPPIAQQVFGDDGNLTRIVFEAGDTGEPKLGWTGVRSFLLPHLGPIPAWFRPAAGDLFELRSRTGLTLPPLGLLVFVGGGLAAFRRRGRDPDPLFFVGVTASLWLIGAFSISQLSGFPAPYLYRWVRVLGIVLWAAGLWPLGRAVMDAAPRARISERIAEGPRVVRPLARPAAGSVLACAVVGTLTLGVAYGERVEPFQEYRRKYQRTELVVQAATEATRRRQPEGGTVEVRSGGTAIFTVNAVVAALERAGYHVLIESGGGTVWGGHRRPGTGKAETVLLITDGPSTAESHPGLRRVGSVDMLSPAERRFYERAPSVDRCAEIVAGAGSDAEREECWFRATLVGSNRHLTIWVGPGEA